MKKNQHHDKIPTLQDAEQTDILKEIEKHFYCAWNRKLSPKQMLWEENYDNVMKELACMKELCEAKIDLGIPAEQIGKWYRICGNLFSLILDGLQPLAGLKFNTMPGIKVQAEITNQEDVDRCIIESLCVLDEMKVAWRNMRDEKDDPNLPGLTWDFAFTEERAELGQKEIREWVMKSIAAWHGVAKYALLNVCSMCEEVLELDLEPVRKQCRQVFDLEKELSDDEEMRLTDIDQQTALLHKIHDPIFLDLFRNMHLYQPDDPEPPLLQIHQEMMLVSMLLLMHMWERKPAERENALEEVKEDIWENLLDSIREWMIDLDNLVKVVRMSDAERKEVLTDQDKCAEFAMTSDTLDEMSGTILSMRRFNEHVAESGIIPVSEKTKVLPLEFLSGWIDTWHDTIQSTYFNVLNDMYEVLINEKIPEDAPEQEALGDLITERMSMSGFETTYQTLHMLWLQKAGNGSKE